MFQPKISERTELASETGDGGFNFDKERAIFMPNKRDAMLEFYLLEGYNPETEINIDAIQTVHSVKGLDRKVVSNRQIRTEEDKKTGELYSYYDKKKDCILTSEMEKSKAVSPDGKSATVNIRGTVAYVLAFVVSAAIQKINRDEKGNITDKELLKYDNVGIQLLELPVQDIFFPKMPGAGIGSKLKKLFDEECLEFNKLRWQYSDLDLVKGKGGVPFLLEKETKDIQKKVKEARENISEIKKKYVNYLPIPYDEYIRTILNKESTSGLNEELTDENPPF